jgi:hypothetical protein
LPPKPGEHIGVHAQAHQLLDWPVEKSDLNVRGTRTSFRRIGVVDLRIRAIREPLKFPALPVSDGRGKERARRDSPFLPR